MSSWNVYPDALAALKGCEGSCILSAEPNGAVWAQAGVFSINPDEINNLVGAFTGSYSASSSGVFIGGSKFNFLSCDETVLHARSGPKGVLVGKSNKAILVAVYNDNSQSGVINNKLYNLVDYLKSSGH